MFVNVNLDVNRVPIAEEENVLCKQRVLNFKCDRPAKYWFILGKIRMASCNSANHINHAIKKVAHTFAKEMVRLHGAVHFKQTQELDR